MGASHTPRPSATIGEPHTAVGCSLPLVGPVSGADPFVGVQAGGTVPIGKEPKMFTIKHFTLYPSTGGVVLFSPFLLSSSTHAPECLAMHLELAHPKAMPIKKFPIIEKHLIPIFLAYFCVRKSRFSPY
jgi:hypothetical protein